MKQHNHYIGMLTETIRLLDFYFECVMQEPGTFQEPDDTVIYRALMVCYQILRPHMDQIKKHQEELLLSDNYIAKLEHIFLHCENVMDDCRKPRLLQMSMEYSYKNVSEFDEEQEQSCQNRCSCEDED